VTGTHTYRIALAVVICLAAALCALRAGPAAALSFTPPVHYDVGGRPADIAAADVNKDGRLDLVTSAGDGISVLLATGPGRFAPATHVALEHKPGAIAVADFDGDGALDIVTAGYDGTVTVLHGDGAGVFITKGTFPTGPNPTDVVVGDVTGDGVADVATADRGGDGVSILKGDGAGGLLPPLDLPVGDDCSTLLGADFNQDGTMDLAYTRYSWGDYAGFGILLADGAGGFTPMGTYETGGLDALPGGLALGDLNGDDTPDIAVLQGNEGDGRIFTFLGDGLGLFMPASETRFSANVSASGIAVADLNQDRRGDVVTSGYAPGRVTNDGHSWIVPPGPPRIYVMLNAGSATNQGVFYKPTSFLAGRTPGELLLADLNRDGKPDLATTEVKTRSVSVRMNGSLPVLTGVSPAQGRIGDVVTLTGRHFIKRGTTVRFGSRIAGAFLSWTATHIRVKVPAGTAKGSVKVTVTTIMGRSADKAFWRL
jgi:hypothetical protein